MNKELEAIKDAQEDMDFDNVRELSDAYVTSHPEEFTDHLDKVAKAASEKDAREAIVQMIESLRAAGLDEHQWRAEAFHHHRWHPMDIGGVVNAQPEIRNDLSEHPKVRNK